MKTRYQYLTHFLFFLFLRTRDLKHFQYRDKLKILSALLTNQGCYFHRDQLVFFFCSDLG